MRPVVGIVQARTGSTRLPRKVLLPMPDGRPVLHHVIERVRQVVGLDAMLVATTNLPEDDAILQHCHDLKVAVSVGHATDVLDRFYWAAKIVGAATVVRFTADCALLNPAASSKVIAAFAAGGYDYISNIDAGTDGWDTEVFSFDALARAWADWDNAYDRQHVTPSIRLRPALFRVGNVVPARIPNNEKWSIDTQADLNLVRLRYSQMKEAA